MCRFSLEGCGTRQHALQVCSEWTKITDQTEFRPDEEQNEHKLTCGVKKACLNKVLKHLQGKLDAALVQANIISSGIGEWRFVASLSLLALYFMFRFLDVVSKNAGKLEALNYVRKRHGFLEADTVACGDSGNDILMLSGKHGLFPCLA